MHKPLSRREMIKTSGVGLSLPLLEVMTQVWVRRVMSLQREW